MLHHLIDSHQELAIYSAWTRISSEFPTKKSSTQTQLTRPEWITKINFNLYNSSSKLESATEAWLLVKKSMNSTQFFLVSESLLWLAVIDRTQTTLWMAMMSSTTPSTSHTLRSFRVAHPAEMLEGRTQSEWRLIFSKSISQISIRWLRSFLKESEIWFSSDDLWSISSNLIDFWRASFLHVYLNLWEKKKLLISIPN